MAEKALFRDYLARLTAVAAQGDAREESFPVGGLSALGDGQMCHKWLKDRKDRTLTLDDIRTYCCITTALSKTIEVQFAIDKLYPTAEDQPLEISIHGDHR
ncbi:hypothetical protein H5T55_04990 [Candidatus Bipolaricaulota bacterium]|nr:hypothetical protein [Candidatus Bipolaricaulota bacterium]